MPDFSISPGTYSLSVVQPKEEEEEEEDDDDDDDDDDGDDDDDDDDDDDGDDSDLRLPSNNSIHLLTVAWLCFSQHTIGGKNAFLLTPKTSPQEKHPNESHTFRKHFGRPRSPIAFLLLGKEGVANGSTILTAEWKPTGRDDQNLDRLFSWILIPSAIYSLRHL